MCRYPNWRSTNMKNLQTSTITNMKSFLIMIVISMTQASDIRGNMLQSTCVREPINPNTKVGRWSLSHICRGRHDCTNRWGHARIVEDMLEQYGSSFGVLDSGCDWMNFLSCWSSNISGSSHIRQNVYCFLLIVPPALILIRCWFLRWITMLDNVYLSCWNWGINSRRINDKLAYESLLRNSWLSNKLCNSANWIESGLAFRVVIMSLYSG